MRSKPFLILLVVVSLLVVPAMFTQEKKAAAGESVDLLIAGGMLVDGSGKAPRVADVGIRGDRIVFIGNAAKAKVTAARTVDARGLIAAPGFIDPHTHTAGDLSSPTKKGNVNYLMQGVTTVITGNDGGGPLNVGETLKKWEEQGIGTNAALYVGHGTVRRKVLGAGDVQPTTEQLAQMKELVRTAMQEGALGLSSGLFYVPGSFSKTEEVIELAKVAGEMGGIYDTHMRDESNYNIGVLGSIEETLRIGREAKIPVNISHIKMLGPDVWGQSARAIELIRKAQAQGVRVTADQYPYTASGSNLIASLMPPWAQAGGSVEMLARVNDESLREKLLQEMGQNLKRRGGADALLFTSQQAPEIVGKTLAAVAKERNKSALETALDLVREYVSKGGGGLSVASFNMNEDDIVRLMKQDFVMTGSDGSAGHPRMYGTYPKKLREYVYTKKVISLPFFVQHSAAMPAEALHIAERGTLREGYFADVVVFDPATVTDKSTYQKPEELAVGMKFVIVNGKLAVENGEYNGALAGRALRRK
ncbi:MAG TPA: D-aminoacylase [Candidatus Acidoferrales bacterium]|nr:D-aminoacylase [Candidatus Acidoferrales bacterium]